MRTHTAALLKAGNLEKALGLATTCRDVASAHLGERHPEFRSAMRALAAAHHAIGHHEEAEALLKQVLNLHHATPRADTAEFLDDLNNLANLYTNTKNFQAAKQVYRQALEMPHPSHRLLSDAGRCFLSCGDYQDAARLLQRAWDVIRKPTSDQPLNLDILLSYDSRQMLLDVARAHYWSGNYALAEVPLEQALKNAESSGNRNSAEIAAARLNLAVVRSKGGQTSAAASLVAEVRQFAKGNAQADALGIPEALLIDCEEAMRLLA